MASILGARTCAAAHHDEREAELRRRGLGLAVAVTLALGVPPARAEVPDGEECRTYEVGGIELLLCSHDICVYVPGQGWKCVPFERCIAPGIPCLPPILNQTVFSQLDPATCSMLIALAPTVDGLGHPELLYIDPPTGDVYVGTGLVWDCPPYEI
jgi:hypothetical protein